MKSITLFAVVFLWLFISCGNDQVQIVKPTEAEKQEIGSVGQEATGILLKTLQAELMGTIEAKGISEAISVCNERAMSLTDSLSENLSRVKDIKRTSFKYRNPRNKPDSYEAEALEFYKSNPENLNEVFIQKIIDRSGTHFRYYKPLTVKPLCTFCHGSVENMAPDLANKIQDLYPDDKASGYNIGDFRGVVRVSIQ